MINFSELRKLQSLSEAVQNVTEASNNNSKMIIDQSGGIHLQYKGKTVINTTSTNLQDTSYETSTDFDFVDEIHKRFINVIGMVQKVKKLVPEMDGILSKKKNQAYSEGSLKLEKADKSEIILSFSIKGNPSLSSLKTSIQPNEVVKVFD